MIVFLTKDLLIQSQVTSAAKTANVNVKIIAQMEAITGPTSDGSITGFLIDLQTPGLKFDELVRQLAAWNDRPRTIAFAQHIKTDLLESAQTDAIDKVMTRGQFVSQITTIIDQFRSAEA